MALLGFKPKIDPGTPLDRWGLPGTSIPTRNQPRRPSLRPFRGTQKLPPGCPFVRAGSQGGTPPQPLRRRTGQPGDPPPTGSRLGCREPKAAWHFNSAGWIWVTLRQSGWSFSARVSCDFRPKPDRWDPRRSLGTAPHIDLHEKSAPQTSSKAKRWRTKNFRQTALRYPTVFLELRMPQVSHQDDTCETTFGSMSLLRSGWRFKRTPVSFKRIPGSF